MEKGISKEKFYYLKDKYGKTSSFAIWGDSVSDMSVFDDANKPWKRVNDKIAIVALNPANETGLLENFHSPNKIHHDETLMMAIKETSLEGCFMTDLSEKITPNSKEVKNENIDIDSLILKLKDVGDIHTIVIFSQARKEIDTILKSKDFKVFRFNHYNIQGFKSIKNYCLDNGIDISGKEPIEQHVLALKHQIKKAKLL